MAVILCWNVTKISFLKIKKLKIFVTFVIALKKTLGCSKKVLKNFAILQQIKVQKGCGIWDFFFKQQFVILGKKKYWKIFFTTVVIFYQKV